MEKKRSIGIIILVIFLIFNTSCDLHPSKLLSEQEKEFAENCMSNLKNKNYQAFINALSSHGKKVMSSPEEVIRRLDINDDVLGGIKSFELEKVTLFADSSRKKRTAFYDVKFGKYPDEKAIIKLELMHENDIVKLNNFSIDTEIYQLPGVLDAVKEKESKAK